MIEILDNIIQGYNEYIGGYLLLFILIPAGIYFTFKLRFLQITKLGHAIKIVAGKYDTKEDKGDINHFKALTTALSATVGTGNIVGVALAIYYGGPGAMFWIWVTGFLGMMLKMVECTLALKYRKINSDGTVSGGPMYYMEALKGKIGKSAKVMAVIFAGAAVLCSLGTGNMAQANSMTDVLHNNYGISTLWSGAVIAILSLVIIVGGLKRIADVTSKLVPIMAVFYFISAITIIIIYYQQIPATFSLIIHDAFTGTAAAGGFVGSAFIMTLTFGVRRGLFSNEAGQGSAPIAHAAAKTDFPIREGLVSSIEPMVDTIIICSLTAFVIIMTGAWQSGVEGVGMTVTAFEIGFSQIGIGYAAKHVIAGGLLLFAFSTIISWSYYGTRAVQYLFGDKAIKWYYYVYALFVFLGSVGGIDIVWHFVDMVITFMTIPNLIALMLLAPVFKKEVDDYFEYMRGVEGKEGKPSLIPLFIRNRFSRKN